MSDQPAPLTRFAGESWNTAVTMHARVVGAVVMRDLQTRFGSGYAGFLVGLIMPLGHLGITLAIMTILARTPPLGASQLTFLMTGILPFILWTYCHRQVMICIAQNHPLLYFPGVDVFDLIFARAIVEVANGTMVVLIVVVALAVLGLDVAPGNLPGFLFSLIEAWGLGIATGLIIGSVGSVAPPVLYAGGLLPPLFWVASGLLYLPDAAPEPVRNIIFYMPLAQIVDGTRVAYFSEYYSTFYDPLVLYSTMLGLFLFGIGFIPIVRRVT